MRITPSVCVRDFKGQFDSGFFQGELTFACIEDRNSVRQPEVELPMETYTRMLTLTQNTHMEYETVPKEKYMADTHTAWAAKENLFKSVLKWAKKQKLALFC